MDLPLLVAVLVSLSLLVLLPPVAVAAPPVAVAVPPVVVTITVTFPVEPKPELSREVLSVSNCPDTRPKSEKITYYLQT